MLKCKNEKKKKTCQGNSDFPKANNNNLLVMSFQAVCKKIIY